MVESTHRHSPGMNRKLQVAIFYYFHFIAIIHYQVAEINAEVAHSLVYTSRFILYFIIISFWW